MKLFFYNPNEICEILNIIILVCQCNLIGFIKQGAGILKLLLFTIHLSTFHNVF